MSDTWKDIRIFISSTFNDMHAERDYLVKYVFPELTEWCEARRLRLVDIDLRWGVTKEESESNNALRKCLENIEECRPFFLCLIGQRRGWIPNDPLRMGYEGKSLLQDSEISEETINQYPEVVSKAYGGRFSVTEMEIEHALLHPMYRVLQNRQKPSGKKCHAVFFERKDGWQPLHFSDVHKRVYTNADVCGWGGDPAQADAAMEDTKCKIRAYQPIITYTCRWDETQETSELSTEIQGDILKKGRLTDFKVNGNSFKDTVLEELKRVILIEYPDRTNSCIADEDDYALDREQQELFVQTASEGYAPRSEWEGQLKTYLQQGARKAMLITASAGLGKTTLLAHFVRSGTGGFDPEHGVFRFCGVSDLTNDTYTLWDSICRQTQVAPPKSMDDLRQNMSQILNRIREAGFHHIVIDAINQLQDGENMLQIIPPELPPGLKLILSIKKSDPDDGRTLQDRFIVCSMTGIDSDEIKNNLIDFFLKRYLKALDNEQKKSLCALDQSKNPLFLKIILHELHFFGAYKQLPDEIAKYKTSPKHAFDQMLIRLESGQIEHVISPEQSVPFLFGLLAYARNGLTEKELFRCFSQRFKPTDSNGEGAYNERIIGTIRYYLRQVRPFMARRNGRIDFLYDSFKDAASCRYANMQNVLHQTLSACFRQLCDPQHEATFDSDNTRALIELGFHTTASDYHKGERLYSQLAYLDARCSQASVRLLLTEMDRFQGDLCRSFHQIISRFQSLLSNYPNALFSICRAEKTSPAYVQTEILLTERRWSKAWLETETLFAIQEDEDEEQNAHLTLKLAAVSDPLVFSEGFVFLPAANLLVFAETLGQLRAFDTHTFALSPCVIYTQPVRVVSLKISADGAYLAAAREDAVIELFELKYNPDGQLQHATSRQQLPSFKPKRGFASFGFLGQYLCYQSDEHTISAFDVVTSVYSVWVQTDQPFILDALASLKDKTLFAVRQGMYSRILYYAPSDKAVSEAKTLEGVFVRRSCVLGGDHLGLALSDDRMLVFDASGCQVAECQMTEVVRSIVAMDDDLHILLLNDKYIVWNWAENSMKTIAVEKSADQRLHYMTVADDQFVLCLLGAAVAKYEWKDGGALPADKKIIAFNETPDLTAAVLACDRNCVTIQQNGLCSVPVSLEEQVRYFACLTTGGAYLLSEYGRGYYLPPDQSQFHPLTEDGGITRILKSWSTPDGCVYYINTLWNFCCGQSNFAYDLSDYRFTITDFYASGRYVFLFGVAAGVQATRNASTGHEPLTGTFLIFESIRPGLLRFVGERLFPAGYGVPVSVAYHPDTEQIYVLFNTPYSGNRKDFLHVCFGKKEDLIAGSGCHADLTVWRRDFANPTSVCVSNSYLVCYQGAVFSYDAATLTYQAAVTLTGSFDKLQSPHDKNSYALALTDRSTAIKQVTIHKQTRKENTK